MCINIELSLCRGGVVVDYAVTVVVDGSGVSLEQLDYLTLQSNRVENSYREVMELPTVVYAINEVKDIITEALHNNELDTVKTSGGQSSSAGIPRTVTEHTNTPITAIYLIGMAAGNTLAELVRAAQGNRPNVISNTDTVDPTLTLEHTLHHLRKHSRVLIVSSVSYLSEERRKGVSTQKLMNKEQTHQLQDPCIYTQILSLSWGELSKRKDVWNLSLFLYFNP